MSPERCRAIRQLRVEEILRNDSQLLLTGAAATERQCGFSRYKLSVWAVRKPPDGRMDEAPARIAGIRFFCAGQPIDLGNAAVDDGCTLSEKGKLGDGSKGWIGLDLVVYFPSSILVTEFAFKTAADGGGEQDPIRFTLHGSADGRQWYPLNTDHDKAKYDVPEERDTWTSRFRLKDLALEQELTISERSRSSKCHINSRLAGRKDLYRWLAGGRPRPPTKEIKYYGELLSQHIDYRCWLLQAFFNSMYDASEEARKAERSSATSARRRSAKASSGGQSAVASAGISGVTGTAARCLMRALLEPTLKSPQAGLLLTMLNEEIAAGTRGYQGAPGKLPVALETGLASVGDMCIGVLASHDQPVQVAELLVRTARLRGNWRGVYAVARWLVSASEAPAASLAPLWTLAEELYDILSPMGMQVMGAAGHWTTAEISEPTGVCSRLALSAAQLKALGDGDKATLQAQVQRSKCCRACSVHVLPLGEDGQIPSRLHEHEGCGFSFKTKKDLRHAKEGGSEWPSVEDLEDGDVLTVAVDKTGVVHMAVNGYHLGSLEACEELLEQGCYFAISGITVDKDAVEDGVGSLCINAGLSPFLVELKENELPWSTVAEYASFKDFAKECSRQDTSGTEKGSLALAFLKIMADKPVVELPIASTKQHTFETKHPHPNNMTEETKVLRYPGAYKLVVKFDSRCSTLGECGVLLIGTDPVSYRQTGIRATGTTWPDTTFQGSVLHYSWIASGHGFWGWMFTVEVHYPGASEEQLAKAGENAASCLQELVELMKAWDKLPQIELLVCLLDALPASLHSASHMPEPMLSGLGQQLLSWSRREDSVGERSAELLCEYGQMLFGSADSLLQLTLKIWQARGEFHPKAASIGMQVSTGHRWFGELVEKDESWELVGKILDLIIAQTKSQSTVVASLGEQDEKVLQGQCRLLWLSLFDAMVFLLNNHTRDAASGWKRFCATMKSIFELVELVLRKHKEEGAAAAQSQEGEFAPLPTVIEVLVMPVLFALTSSASTSPDKQPLEGDNTSNSIGTAPGSWDGLCSLLPQVMVLLPQARTPAFSRLHHTLLRFVASVGGSWNSSAATKELMAVVTENAGGVLDLLKSPLLRVVPSSALQEPGVEQLPAPVHVLAAEEATPKGKVLEELGALDDPANGVLEEIVKFASDRVNRMVQHLYKAAAAKDQPPLFITVSEKIHRLVFCALARQFRAEEACEQVLESCDGEEETPAGHAFDSIVEVWMQAWSLGNWVLEIKQQLVKSGQEPGETEEVIEEALRLVLVSRGASRQVEELKGGHDNFLEELWERRQEAASGVAVAAPGVVLTRILSGSTPQSITSSSFPESLHRQLSKPQTLHRQVSRQFQFFRKPALRSKLAIGKAPSNQLREALQAMQRGENVLANTKQTIHRVSMAYRQYAAGLASIAFAVEELTQALEQDQVIVDATDWGQLVHQLCNAVKNAPSPMATEASSYMALRSAHVRAIEALAGVANIKMKSIPGIERVRSLALLGMAGPWSYQDYVVAYHARVLAALRPHLPGFSEASTPETSVAPEQARAAWLCLRALVTPKDVTQASAAAKEPSSSRKLSLSTAAGASASLPSSFSTLLRAVVNGLVSALSAEVSDGQGGGALLEVFQADVCRTPEMEVDDWVTTVGAALAGQMNHGSNADFGGADMLSDIAQGQMWFDTLKEWLRQAHNETLPLDCDVNMDGIIDSFERLRVLEQRVREGEIMTNESESILSNRRWCLPLAMPRFYRDWGGETTEARSLPPAVPANYCAIKSCQASMLRVMDDLVRANGFSCFADQKSAEHVKVLVKILTSGSKSEAEAILAARLLQRLPEIEAEPQQAAAEEILSFMAKGGTVDTIMLQGPCATILRNWLGQGSATGINSALHAALQNSDVKLVKAALAAIATPLEFSLLGTSTTMQGSDCRLVSMYPAGEEEKSRAFMTDTSRFLSASEDGSVRAGSLSAGPQEWWKIEQQSDGVLLRSHYGKLLRVQDDGKTLIADAAEDGDGERFQMVVKDGGGPDTTTPCFLTVILKCEKGNVCFDEESDKVQLKSEPVIWKAMGKPEEAPLMSLPCSGKQIWYGVALGDEDAPLREVIGQGLYPHQEVCSPSSLPPDVLRSAVDAVAKLPKAEAWALPTLLSHHVAAEHFLTQGYLAQWIQTALESRSPSLSSLPAVEKSCLAALFRLRGPKGCERISREIEDAAAMTPPDMSRMASKGDGNGVSRPAVEGALEDLLPEWKPPSTEQGDKTEKEDATGDDVPMFSFEWLQMKAAEILSKPPRGDVLRFSQLKHSVLAPADSEGGGAKQDEEQLPGGMKKGDEQQKDRTIGNAAGASAVRVWGATATNADLLVGVRQESILWDRQRLAIHACKALLEHCVEEGPNALEDSAVYRRALLQHSKLLVKLYIQTTHLENEEEKTGTRSMMAHLARGSQELQEAVLEVGMAHLLGSLGKAPKGKPSGQDLHFASPHPYLDDTHLPWTKVHVPGATSLKIVFHPQCETEIGQDKLYFKASVPFNGMMHLPEGAAIPDASGDMNQGRVGPLDWVHFRHGTGDMITRPELVLPADTFEFTFWSNPYGNYWGYEFDVIPVDVVPDLVKDREAAEAEGPCPPALEDGLSLTSILLDVVPRKRELSQDGTTTLWGMPNLSRQVLRPELASLLLLHLRAAVLRQAKRLRQMIDSSPQSARDEATDEHVEELASILQRFIELCIELDVSMDWGEAHETLDAFLKRADGSRGKALMQPLIGLKLSLPSAESGPAQAIGLRQPHFLPFGGVVTTDGGGWCTATRDQVLVPVAPLDCLTATFTVADISVACAVPTSTCVGVALVSEEDMSRSQPSSHGVLASNLPKLPAGDDAALLMVDLATGARRGTHLSEDGDIFEKSFTPGELLEVKLANDSSEVVFCVPGRDGYSCSLPQPASPGLKWRIAVLLGKIGSRAYIAASQPSRPASFDTEGIRSTAAVAEALVKQQELPKSFVAAAFSAWHSNMNSPKADDGPSAGIAIPRMPSMGGDFSNNAFIPPFSPAGRHQVPLPMPFSPGGGLPESMQGYPMMRMPSLGPAGWQPPVGDSDPYASPDYPTPLIDRSASPDSGFPAPPAPQLYDPHPPPTMPMDGSGWEAVPYVPHDPHDSMSPLGSPGPGPGIPGMGSLAMPPMDDLSQKNTVVEYEFKTRRMVAMPSEMPEVETIEVGPTDASRLELELAVFGTDGEKLPESRSAATAGVKVTLDRAGLVPVNLSMISDTGDVVAFLSDAEQGLITALEAQWQYIIASVGHCFVHYPVRPGPCWLKEEYMDGPMLQWPITGQDRFLGDPLEPKKMERHGARLILRPDKAERPEVDGELGEFKVTSYATSASPNAFTELQGGVFMASLLVESIEGTEPDFYVGYMHAAAEAARLMWTRCDGQTMHVAQEASPEGLLDIDFGNMRKDPDVKLGVGDIIGLIVSNEGNHLELVCNGKCLKEWDFDEPALPRGAAGERRFLIFGARKNTAAVSILSREEALARGFAGARSTPLPGPLPVEEAKDLGKIVVNAKFVGVDAAPSVGGKASSDAAAEEAAKAHPEAWADFQRLGVDGWSGSADKQLVKILDWLQVQKSGEEPTTAAALAPFNMGADLKSRSEAWEKEFPVRQETDFERLHARYFIVREFNVWTSDKLLPHCSLGTLRSVKFGRALSDAAEWLFCPLRMEEFSRILMETCNSSAGWMGSTGIVLDRSKKTSLAEENEVDRTGDRSLFGQAASQIAALSVVTLRATPGQQPFMIRYVNEPGSDGGGLYRDFFDRCGEELMSNTLPLLTPTANNESSAGDYQEAWQIAPGPMTTAIRSMYYFMGQLMGICLRRRDVLPICLSPATWKALCGRELTLEDLFFNDSLMATSISHLLQLDALNITEANFERVFGEIWFVCLNWKHEEVPLCHGGADKKVTFHNAKEYVDLVIQYKTSECKEQVAAIRQGMATVVPVAYFSLWTPSDLETRVCGSSEVDIELLKRKTNYIGYSPEERQIKDFWTVLGELSNSDLSRYLRFVWGRSRLPPESMPEQWGNGHQVTRANNLSEQDLPMAHTCYFQIDLPAYSTQEILRSKLLFAIQNCVSVMGGA